MHRLNPTFEINQKWQPCRYDDIKHARGFGAHDARLANLTRQHNQTSLANMLGFFMPAGNVKRNRRLGYANRKKT
jgi:hypothetical protein